MSALLISSRPRKAMSLTALIDVVFILLLFFMLTSTFDKTKSINLLTASQGEEVMGAQSKVQLVHIQTENEYRLLNDRNEQSFVSLSMLINSLDTKEKVVLLPNEKTSVQQIVQTLDFLSSNNVNDVTLGNVLQTSIIESK